MEFVQKLINEEYLALFFVEDSILNIYVHDKKGRGREKSEFMPIQLNFKDKFREYILNFSDLIQQIKEGNKIEIKLEKYLKYLQLEISHIQKNETFIIQKIYQYNVEYYLTKGAKNERINAKPYSSYIDFIDKDYYNIEDILELIEKENLLNSYTFDYFRYYDDTKKAFLKLENNNIQIKKKNILEFHINGKKNNFLANIKTMKQYYIDEIMKIKNKINKYSDFETNYDLIYLYASPVVENDDYNEHPYLIKYQEEIKNIVELMQNTRKKFKCKFECLNEDVLKDTLINYKTKVLHISAHGSYDGKYSLNLENNKDKGQPIYLNYDQLKNYLTNANKANLSQIDLVIVSTCYSEDFGLLFHEFGVKNVIYIKQNTEVIDNISIFFTKIFYKYLFEGKTIKESYDEAMKILREDKEMLRINYKYSCCCNHSHLIDLKNKEDKKRTQKKEIDCKEEFHSIHKKKRQLCFCIFEKPNYHHKRCLYFNKYKDLLSNPEKTVKEVRKDVFQICCCDLGYEHDEIEKIIYNEPDLIYSNFAPFKYNAKGDILINSIIRTQFEQKNLNSVEERKSLIGRIYNSINLNKNFVIFFGKKGLLKLNFTQNLCFYLLERKMIDNYEIFRINSKEDLTNMMNKTQEDNNNQNLKLSNKKNVKVIKFDKDNLDENANYLIEIHQKFCLNSNLKLYFIFIFNWEERDENKIKTSLEEIFTKNKKEIKLIINENLFYAGIKDTNYLDLFDYYLNESNIKLTEKQKTELKRDGSLQTIKKICEQLLEGKSIQEITEIKDFEKYIEIIENQKKLSYLLYYLLSNMSSGLPDSFLELIFENYDRIDDYKLFITRSIENNWTIIKRDKFFYDNFKENKFSEDCNTNLLKALKIYTELLNYFIEKNRKKIYNKYGNIHYIYNSYNNGNIWKCKRPSLIEKKLGKKILHKDFSIVKHKQNIINLICSMINKINSLASPEQIGESLAYLEDILLLFPSYFFLKKENFEILQVCIGLCDKLIKKIEKSNFIYKDQYLKREKYLKQKLLIFLYSIDESQNEILGENLIEKDLKKELDLLKLIRKKDIKPENLEKLEKNISEEKKFYLYYEYAKFYFNNKEYKNSMEYLNKALDLKININDMAVKRIIIDYCYSFLKEYIRKKMENVIINEDYNILIENTKKLKGIMKKPIQKNIYFEAFELRKELYNLLEPDIVMLNSNPLKNLNNYDYYPNNQYYILNELKQNIKSYIRIKSDILNKENLKLALNEKGKILIIQSDDFSKDGDLILENERGESNILLKKDFIQMIKEKEIKYKIMILCFPKSSKLIEELNNTVDCLVTFDNFDNFKDEKFIMKKYNHESIQFLIDFTTRIIDNKNNKEYDAIFNAAKETFLNNIKDIKNQFKSRDYIISIKGQNFDNSKIIFENIIKRKKVFLYGTFPKFKSLNYEDNDFKDYSSQIYELIEYFNHENLKIFYCNNRNNEYYLNFSLETMKFFYRHKTYCELFNIDFMKKSDKIILKSLIRKLKEIKDEDNEDTENEENDEEIQQKYYFVLIYNCNLKDILDINLYSVLNRSNSSFIIIYNEDIYSDFKKGNKVNMHLEEGAEKMKFDLIENANKFEKSTTKIKEEKEKVFNFIYNIEDEINCGEYSQIFIARNKEEKEGDKKLYSIKFLRKDKMDNNRRLAFNNEIEILRELSKILNNKYTPIIYDYKLYDVKKFENEKKEGENINENREERDENNSIEPYIVMDYFSKGLLFDYIVSGRLKEKGKKFIFKKIIEAYKFLYEHNICHLNLTNENIMLDKNLFPIIIDFAFSQKTKDKNGNLILLNAKDAFENYSAPEIFELKKFNGEKVDIFSLGVILFNLVTMERGFGSSRINDKLYRLIKKKDYNKYWMERKILNLSEDFKDLYLKMVAYNPNERPSCGQILNHPWFDEVNKLSPEDEEEIKREIKDIYDIMIKDKEIYKSIEKKILDEKVITR